MENSELITCELDIQHIHDLFVQYGYELKESNESYKVYLSHQGMYYGAEIIVLQQFDSKPIQERYSKLGYSTKVQKFNSYEEAEQYLFGGFFKTNFTSLAIDHRYEEFALKQVKHYGDPDIKYEYINVPFQVYSDNANNFNGNHIVDSINQLMSAPKAQLIIIEAAAGFGKTCTAFELYRSFKQYSDTIKPLFAELSRERNAKVFKYVLYSEIDNEYGSSIKSDLVRFNITQGRIPLIIDGFDELLSKDIDPGKSGMLNEFDQVETMLSTIGELLQGKAKIILTSRKTAIFAGSEFSEWVDSFNGAFDVTRYQLDKPNIREWLTAERYNIITKNDVPIDYISNPVLLTYLRNVPQEQFLSLIQNPQTITEKYFEHLLNREKQRQGLIIPHQEQFLIFENLSKSFAQFDITGDSRSFVKELIVDYNKSKLLYYRELMPTKQTIDELADTLVNHALLDRIGNKDCVGFINDFVFGYLLAKAVIHDSNGLFLKEKNIPESLIEKAILAYRYSEQKEKELLWNKISGLKDRVALKLSMQIDSMLLGHIKGAFSNFGITSFSFETTAFTKKNCSFKEASFVDVVFDNCKFDLDAFNLVTFTGCKFKDCQINDKITASGNNQIHCYGCEDFGSGFITEFEGEQEMKASDDIVKPLEIRILSKYFKVDGKSTKMKYISTLRSEFNKEEIDELFFAFAKLKKLGYIQTNGNNSFISQLGINYYHSNCVK